VPQAGFQGLTPIILATQEAEIKRITVRSQCQANSSQELILKKTHHKKTDWWNGSSGEKALCRKCEVLSLNPSIVQKKKNVPQEYLLPFLP
jgi:hypothetical protein